MTNDYNLTAVEQAESLIKLVQPQSSVVPKFIVFLAKKNRLRGLFLGLGFRYEYCWDFVGLGFRT